MVTWGALAPTSGGGLVSSQIIEDRGTIHPDSTSKAAHFCVSIQFYFQNDDSKLPRSKQKQKRQKGKEKPTFNTILQVSEPIPWTKADSHGFTRLAGCLQHQCHNDTAVKTKRRERRARRHHAMAWQDHARPCFLQKTRRPFPFRLLLRVCPPISNFCRIIAPKI